MTKTIDYFFGIGSPWAFLGLEPFAALAAEHNATIRPYVIPLIEDNGAIYSRNRPEARRAYWTKDLKRWAALRGKSLNFDNRAALSDPTPAGFMVIAAIDAREDWLRLTKALQEASLHRGCLQRCGTNRSAVDAQRIQNSCPYDASPHLCLSAGRSSGCLPAGKRCAGTHGRYAHRQSA